MLQRLLCFAARPLRKCRPSLFTRHFSFTPGRAFPRVPRSLHEATHSPSFREELAKSAPVESFTSQLKPPHIRNQVLFFIVGSYLAFTLAAIQTNIDTDYWSKKLTAMSPVWIDRAPTNDEMRRTQYYELGRRLQNKVMELKESTADLPLFLKNLVLMSYVKMAQPYLDTTDGRRLCWNICALNTAIWIAWHIPPLKPVMHTRFMHHPLSGLSYTLLTSTFSHKGIFHLLFNCMALTSFGSAAAHYLSRESQQHQLQESTPKWQLLSFFLSAGLFSGLVSHVIAVKFRYPRLLSQISPSPAGSTAKTATSIATGAASKISDIVPSLGASGAIYATVTLTALGFPETEIALLFPPTFPIPIQYGVGALVAMDLVGVIRGWRYLDHWAHLGGAAFGAVYWAYGAPFWTFMRKSHESIQHHTKEGGR